MNNIINRINQFLDALKENGWEPISQRHKDWDLVLRMMDEYETEEHVIPCEKCEISYLVLAFLQRGFSDHEMVKCKKCGSPLREIRADVSYEFVATKPYEK